MWLDVAGYRWRRNRLISNIVVYRPTVCCFRSFLFCTSLKMTFFFAGLKAIEM